MKQALLRRLLAKAKREKVRYEPFNYEYVHYSIEGISIDAQILKPTGRHTCWVLAYSSAAPFGKQGEVDIAQIDRMTDIHIMTADDFEKARHLKWPDDFSSLEVVSAEEDRPSAPSRQIPSRTSAAEVLSRVQVLRDGNAQGDKILSALNPTSGLDVHQP